ncbi:MAG: response regulator transcription factor [Lachnospiraceae bacterium]|nr:response regulator transcription factor [Lachnospiraceae bacterium]
MKLLFASAERDLLLCYSRLLQTEGREVLTAFDGPQLLSQLSGSPDLIIADAALPRLDTAGLIRFLKNEGIRLILLLNDKKQKNAFRENLPEEAFLSYPFSPEELEEKIRETMNLTLGKAVIS